jgi:hypothetical protein
LLIFFTWEARKPMKMRAWTPFGVFFNRINSRRQTLKPKTRSSHYAAERLESRLLFTTDVWQFVHGGDWDTAGNWSLGIPTATEDVSIPHPGTYTITHSGSTADSFKSLTSTVGTVEIDLTNGSLTQDGASNSASQISGTFTISGGATLSVTGGTFTASGTTTFSGANLTATSGGQMSFLAATSFSNGSFNTYTIAANGVGSKINLADLTTFSAGPGTFDVTPTAGGEIDLSGQITGTVQFSNSGGGIVSFSGPGNSVASISISGAGSIFKFSAVAQIYTVSSLSITGFGTLDLANNELIVDYGSGPDPNGTIRQELISGFNGGGWNGTGINSSSAAVNHAYALGYADGTDGVVSGLTSGQVEIKFTLYGDVDLNGVVNGSDFTSLVGYLGTAESRWDQGDFLYTGAVTGSDFTALIGNLGKSASGAAVTLPANNSTSLIAAVPTSTVLSTAATASASPVAKSHASPVVRSHSRRHG